MALKFIVNNPERYKRLKRKSFVKNFVVFNPDHYEEIGSPHDHANAMQDIITNDFPTKLTVLNRFEEVNNALLELLKNNSRELLVHDIAVSNGMTSLELKRVLDGNGYKSRIYISDKYSSIQSIAVSPLLKIYLDEYDAFYGANLCGLIFCSKNVSWKYALSKIAGIIISSLPVINNKSRVVISLLFRDVLELIRKQDLCFIPFDVFDTKLSVDFDVVRCMNLLNIYYFPEDKLLAGILNIKASLKESGFLILGRTEGAENHATIYQKIKNTLERRATIGTGSEIDYLVRRIELNGE